MTENSSELNTQVPSSVGNVDKANLFERVVSSKNGRQTIKLSEQQIESTVSNLLQEGRLVGLVKGYRTGLANPNSFTDTDEISLRQKIFPLIDEELRKIDPTYQIFGDCILDKPNVISYL